MARPGARLELQITLTNQFTTDLSSIAVELALPPGITPIGDPPFVTPTNSGAAYNSTTRTISWSGPIPGAWTRYITFLAELEADGTCQEKMVLNGTSTGNGNDIGSSLTIFKAPSPPNNPYLIGVEQLQGLWMFEPGVDTSMRSLLCFQPEIFSGLGEAPNGDIYVTGLPTLRFNPRTLDFEIFGQDFYEAFGFDQPSELNDVAFDLSTTPPTAVFVGGSKVWRYNPVTRGVTLILDDASLGDIELVSVDPDGKIVAVSNFQRLIRIDPGGSLPLPQGSYEMLDTTVNLPFGSSLDTLTGQGVRHLSLDTDGNYIITVATEFRDGDLSNPPFQIQIYTLYSLARIDRTTGRLHLIEDVVSATTIRFPGPTPPLPSFLTPLLPVDMLNSSLAAGSASGDVYYGTSFPGSLSVVRRTPAVSGEVLIGPSFSNPTAEDLEWVVPSPPNNPPLLAVIEDKVINVGTTLNVAVSATDPDGDPITLTALVLSPFDIIFFTFATLRLPPFATFTDNGDGTGTLSLAPGFGDEGVYMVEITASDGDRIDSRTFTIVVKDINRPPVADAAGPYVANEGDTIQLNASGSSDPDGNTISFEWQFQGQSFFDVFVEISFGDNFDGIARLIVDDGLGGTNMATARVTFNNVASAVEAGPDRSVNVGETVILAPASFTDPGILDSHTATIDWGDGSPFVSGTVSENGGSGTVSGSRTYGSEGSFTVTVCVKDDDGGTGCDTLNVRVIMIQPVMDLYARAKSGKIDIVWTHVGANSYNVYRSDNGAVYTFIANTTSTYSVYADFGLTNGVKYCYKVKSVYASGLESEYSNITCATPTALRR